MSKNHSKEQRMVAGRSVSAGIERCQCGKRIAALKGSRGMYAVDVPADSLEQSRPWDLPRECEAFMQVNTTKFHECDGKFQADLSKVRDFMLGGMGRKKVTFRPSDSRLSTVQFAMNSDGNRIWVTDGGPFGGNRFFGSISVETGVFVNAGFPLSREGVSTILAVNEDPEKAAKAHAKVWGLCCFCNSALTDATSIANGYGPVCAKKWGMSWAKVA